MFNETKRKFCFKYKIYKIREREKKDIKKKKEFNNCI